jgi:hypothetical protein
MRYALAGRDTLSALMTGSGLLAGTIGLAVGLARRAIGPLAIPLAVGGGLLWLGRNLGDSYVDVGDDLLHIKLGAIFDERIPLAEIARVSTTEWGWLGGLGVRSNLKDMVAIVTRTGTVAELDLRRPLRLPVIPRILSVPARRLLVSPEHVEAFVAELESRLSP